MPKRANRRCSGYMIFSHLKHSAFTATRLEKGVPFKFVNRRYTIAVPFQLKVVYKRAANRSISNGLHTLVSKDKVG